MAGVALGELARYLPCRVLGKASPKQVSHQTHSATDSQRWWGCWGKLCTAGPGTSEAPAAELALEKLQALSCRKLLLLNGREPGSKPLSLCNVSPMPPTD